MKKLYIGILFLAFLFHSSEMNAQSSYLGIIKEYLLGEEMYAEDFTNFRIQRTSFSESLQATNVYMIQEYNNIPIYNAIGSCVIKDQKVVSFSGRFYNDLAKKIYTTEPVLTPINALQYIAQDLGLPKPGNVEVVEKNQNSTITLQERAISQENIPVKLVYFFQENELILAWDMSIYTPDGTHWYSIRVDASNGTVIDKTDWIINCLFDNHTSDKYSKGNSNSVLFRGQEGHSAFMEGAYNVFPIPSVESPNHGSRMIVSNPANAIASPYGWHDTDGVVGAEFTTTQGNNVLASEDIDGDNVAGNSPDGGRNLRFNFPLNQNSLVTNFEKASVTNLFYVNNIVHDVWYQYGFDESSGNFQFNNYGRGGIESDEVLADSQDGSGFNNANFGTPPDGFNPRMQMFLWNPVPDPAVSTFVVNNGAFAGSYETVDNSFSSGHVDAPEFPDGLTADLVLVTNVVTTVSGGSNDACEVIINTAELKDKIAVIKRGTCDFDDKVFRCQESGAIAVLVVNSQSGTPIAMEGNNGAITIPAIMMRKGDGEALIAAMAANTVSATISDLGRNLFAEDSSFDNGIVIHEYGHGISTRLTGGADNSGCLRTCIKFDANGDCIQFTEQMGEGWSDWFALMMTINAGDTGGDTRGIGTYSVNQPVNGRGIRPFPYSTNMSINPVTYTDTNNESTFSAPHGVGSIWTSMLWDLTWEFIERDGFDPDLYNGKGGNNLAMQLVVDGLKLQACNPGFVDGRDAILMADEVANDGVNACLIWQVFAKRGLGWSASQGDSLLRTDQTEAFDMPPASELQCLLAVEDFEKGVFRVSPNPSSGNFTLNISQAFGESTIRIADINGRIVFEKDILLNSSYNIDATDISAGVYLLQLSTQSGKYFTTKIVIR